MEADSTGNMGDKAEMEMGENPFEAYVESIRQQLEDQDPVFLIGVIVALAAVVITCGRKLGVSMLMLAWQARPIAFRSMGSYCVLTVLEFFYFVSGIEI